MSKFTWQIILNRTLRPRRPSSVVRLKSYREVWLISAAVGDDKC